MVITAASAAYLNHPVERTGPISAGSGCPQMLCHALVPWWGRPLTGSLDVHCRSVEE